MNGIDSSAGAFSRIESLQPVGPQGASGTTQTGVSALANGAARVPSQTQAEEPQPSTQTVLSAVALALDAIVRSGADAMQVVVGTEPLWPNPDDGQEAGAQTQPDTAASLALGVMEFLDAQAGTLLRAADAADAGEAGALADSLQDAADGDAAGAGAGTAAVNADGTAADGTAAGAAQAAGAAAASGQSAAVAALAASLRQTVADSGLFYESHLAQWLAGQRTLADLAGEPQNRLAGDTAQLPLDWSLAADTADDVPWTDAQPTGAGQREEAAQGGAGSPLPVRVDEADLADILDPLPQSSLARQMTDDANALLQSAGPQTGGAAASVHPAVIPIVRQQLDLLATDEFRWTGEAWPGARFDWTIHREPEDEARRNRRRFTDLDDETPWRTRVTLALPSLGTVDAELTLTGNTLAVRVQAGSRGAARLSAHGDELRSRLAAAGIELTDLSIREIGGGAPAGSDAARAADAYARAAASASASSDASASAHASASATATASTSAPASDTPPGGAPQAGDELDQWAF